MKKAFWWNFRPLDTLFISDGTPFQAGEGGLRGQGSLFPPPINTCQGAIRTALAYGQGWAPYSGVDLPKELGSNKHIGDLILRGPFLSYEDELLFPAPNHILAERAGDKTTYHFLEPIMKYRCDLHPEEDRCLPGLKNNIPGVKPVAGWLNKNDLTKVLAGNLEQITPYQAEDLWARENRIGIEINRETRAAKEQMLYSTFHIRVKNNVSISVSVGGLPESWHDDAAAYINFGGEGRVASIEKRIDNDNHLPTLAELKRGNGKILFTVSLLTHGNFSCDTKEVVLNGPTKWIKGKTITACLGKAIQIGGWDTIEKESRALMPLIPAGSTWFFEADEEYLSDIEKLHGSSIGYHTNMGYGQIVIGRWEGIK
ncbi:MAG: type III-B CRISPR module-associated protein Cmr3 [Syntrophomonadaceae bacterium]|nr:type III-B CRISPR module-associated protein Cmr3 [Syntrophomonadaceae bacterium]